MRKLSAALLALFFAATAARGDWSVVSSRSEFSEGNRVEHRHVVVGTNSGGETVLDLAIFAAKAATLRVIDNAGGHDDLAQAMQRDKCVAGVNGGYFDPQFAPIGLRVIEGAVTSPFVRAKLFTGVLAAAPDRGTELVRLSEFSRKRKLDAAIECGPFLVDLAKPVRGLNNTRSARRTFAAVARDGKATLGYCENATLAELGAILSSAKFEGFSVWRAMNIDGGSSSAFWFGRADGTAFSIGEQKSVRDFLGVAPK